MSKELLELLKEVNESLEGNEHYCLQYVSDGYDNGITTNDVTLAHDGDSHGGRKNALSIGAHYVSTMNDLFQTMLSEEVDAFLKEYLLDAIKERFSHAKVSYFPIKVGIRVDISGGYNEEVMDDFMDTIKQDFEYNFPKMELIYSI